MEFRKLFIVLGIIAILLASPFIFLSDGMMGWYQSRIDANPDSASAKDWQLRLAGICAKTGRPELAAEMYRKFVDRYEEDERRPETFIKLADCLDKAGERRAAIEALTTLYQEYPDTTWAEEANETLTLQFKHYAHR